VLAAGATKAALNQGPANGTLSLGAAGNFSYKPNAGFYGTDTFTYHLVNGAQTSGIATVTITVAETAPATAPDSYQVQVNTPLVVAVASGVLKNDSDAQHDIMSVVLGSVHAANGAVTLNADGSFSYTPNAGFTGTDSFSYVASDGLLTSGETLVTLRVDAVPVGAADQYSVNHDKVLNTNLTNDLLLNDVGTAGDTLKAVLDQGPSHGVLTLHPNGTFSYTPTAGFYGTDSFTYSPVDGTITGGATTVTIAVAETAPVAKAESYQVTQNVALVVPAASGVLKNDTDAQHDVLTAVLSTQASNGLVALNADGSFSYTPNAGFTGTDSFTYAASDGLLASAPVTVTLKVSAVPGGVADQYSVNANKVLSTNLTNDVLVNDTHSTGDTLTAVLNQGPAHGVLTLHANGTFTYTPTTGFVGTDTFSYTPQDGSIAGSPTTVTITVLDTAPVAKADSYQASKGTPLVVGAALGVLANDADIQGNPMTALQVAGPAHGALTLNADGSFTYTPTTNFTGTDSFTYKANDGTLSSAVTKVTLTVTASGGGGGAAMVAAPVTDDAAAPLDQAAATELMLGPSPNFTRLAQLIHDSRIVTTAPTADPLVYDADRGEFVQSGAVWSNDTQANADADWLLVDDLMANALSLDAPAVPTIIWDSAVA